MERKQGTIASLLGETHLLLFLLLLNTAVKKTNLTSSAGVLLEDGAGTVEDGVRVLLVGNNKIYVKLSRTGIFLRERHRIRYEYYYK